MALDYGLHFIIAALDDIEIEFVRRVGVLEHRDHD